MATSHLIEDLTVVSSLLFTHSHEFYTGNRWEMWIRCLLYEHIFKESAKVLVGVSQLAIELLLDWASLVMLINATRSGLIHARSLPPFSSRCQIQCTGHVPLKPWLSRQLSQPRLGSGCKKGRTHVPGSLPPLSVPTGKSHSHIYITVTSPSTSSACVVPPTNIPPLTKPIRGFSWRLTNLSLYCGAMGSFSAHVLYITTKTTKSYVRCDFHMPTKTLCCGHRVSWDKCVRLWLKFRPRTVSFRGWWAWKL